MSECASGAGGKTGIWDWGRPRLLCIISCDVFWLFGGAVLLSFLGMAGQLKK